VLLRLEQAAPSIRQPTVSEAEIELTAILIGHRCIPSMMVNNGCWRIRAAASCETWLSRWRWASFTLNVMQPAVPAVRTPIRHRGRTHWPILRLRLIRLCNDRPDDAAGQSTNLSLKRFSQRNSRNSRIFAETGKVRPSSPKSRTCAWHYGDIEVFLERIFNGCVMKEKMRYQACWEMLNLKCCDSDVESLLILEPSS